MKVRFNYNKAGFRIRRALQHRRWLCRVLLEEGFSEGLIDIVFTDDTDILNINRQFLKHNYFTDVITFDYSEGRRLSGEIYLSVDSVKSNADIFSVPAAVEIRRVMVHGILHLCGYKDSNDKEVVRIRRKEDQYLKLFSDEFHI